MSSLLLGLNDRQQEAVLCTQGPLMVLAGAGSGKTKMLTSRIAYLIQECQVPAYRVMAVTFTNKAAHEMRERVERGLRSIPQFDSEGNPLRRGFPEIGTFHSICLKILRQEISYTPFTAPFVVYDDGDQLNLIKSVLNRLGCDEKTYPPKSVQFVINQAKCHAQMPEELDVQGRMRDLPAIYEEYQKQLWLNQALDFGEILCLTYRLLRDHSDLRSKYQRYFQYIHVDEYQDTNRAQYLLLSLLAATEHGGHQNICVVGDEDQSIYKWRGADIRNILDFDRDFPGARVIQLEQNYRSTQTILAVANQVIRNNQTRRAKTLWTNNAEGQPVSCFQVSSEREEAQRVAGCIQQQLQSMDRSYEDFAIFYRTHAQSRPFEDVFRKEHIPYQIMGGVRFYDRKEIKDILSYFKLILNPSDSVSLKRIINVPTRGLGKTTLERLEMAYEQSHSSLSYGQWLEHGVQYHDPALGTAYRKVSHFIQLIQNARRLSQKKKLTELYRWILEETGYMQALKQEATEEAQARVQNLEEFDVLLAEFEEDQFQGLSEQQREAQYPHLLSIFIEQSSLVSEPIDSENQRSVKLMTLHSSKGLEFPVVFMVGMEEGLFPSLRPWEGTSSEEVEEERRLCYVGMTRAKEHLYLLHALMRRVWGQPSYQKPSRFLSEIPQNLLNQASLMTESHQETLTTSSFQKDFIKKPNRLYSHTPTGRMLLHPSYGQGTVVATEGTGEDQKITIQFEGRLQKKFLLRYVSEYFA